MRFAECRQLATHIGVVLILRVRAKMYHKMLMRLPVGLVGNSLFGGRIFIVTSSKPDCRLGGRLIRRVVGNAYLGVMLHKRI